MPTFYNFLRIVVLLRGIQTRSRRYKYNYLLSLNKRMVTVSSINLYCCSVASKERMIVYQNLLTGDELLSESFPCKEIQDGILWEVDGKWVVKGAIEVNIGANPSEEGSNEEGIDDRPVKVVDIVDTFRLQEQPSFDRNSFMEHMKRYIKSLMPNLPEERQENFKENVEGAVKWLFSKLDDLQL